MKLKLSFLLLGLLFLTRGIGQTPCPDNVLDPVIVHTDATKDMPTDAPDNPPPGPGNEDLDFDRLAFFVHGLGGSSDSWGRVAPIVSDGHYGINDFPARRIISLKPEYSEFDLYGAASELGNELVILGTPHLAPNAPKESGMIIAHSQGGIVSRALDQLIVENNKPRWFGGIATFGSPHAGAAIAQNYEWLYDFVEEGCYDLTIGPLTEEIENNFWLDFIPLSLISNLVGRSCEFVGQDLLPELSSEFILPILDDYGPGDIAIQNLNNFQSSTPLVSFYGVEEDPVFWRVLYNLGIDEPNDFEPFQANGEADFLRTVQYKTDEYEARYNHYFHNVLEFEDKRRSLFNSIFGAATWWAVHNHRYEEVKGIRDNYQKGYHWLYTADHSFRIITGASEFGTQMERVCFCYEIFADQATVVPCSDVASFPSLECDRTVEEVEALFQYENDGIVTAASSTSVPGAINVKLLDANHQQLLNSTQTKEALNGLFNGSYHAFFKTDPR